MEYIDSRVNPKIHEFENLSKKYKKCHLGMMVGALSCLLSSVIVDGIYFIVPIIWLVLTSMILVLVSLFLFIFDSLCQFEQKSIDYKNKACTLNYEKNMYLSKEKGFKSFAYRCENNMD